MFVHNQQEESAGYSWFKNILVLPWPLKMAILCYETRKCETPERMRLADQSQSLRAAWGRRGFCWIVTNFGGRTYVLCNCTKGLATALMYFTCLRFYVKSEYKFHLTLTVNADLTSPVQRWSYCCRMKMCPFYSTMAISTRLSLVLIYLFTYICSVRVVLLFILGHHDAS